MRGLTISIASLLLTALASTPAYAQHPCDIPVPPAYTLDPGEIVRFGFCHSGVDGQGLPVTEWQLILPGGKGSFPIPMVKVTATPSPSGEFLWESQSVKAEMAGEFSVRAVSPNGVSIPSVPITVTLGSLPPPPAPFLSPTNLRLWRQ